VNTKQGLPEARASLLSAWRAASCDQTARAAIEAHRELKLHIPIVEEVGAYRKSGGTVMDQAALMCAESLLFLRTKPLIRGSLKTDRRDFQKGVEARINSSVSPKNEEYRKEFGKLALSFSRLFALYYVDEHERQPDGIGGRLEMALPVLAKHLLSELELCMEERFVRPANNLCKASVFEIRAKLDALEKHADAVVKDNAKTIVHAALVRGNLEFADTLAAGAKAKLDVLQAHADAVVRDNAKTIVCIALNHGNLELSDTLAAGAKAKLDVLQAHADAVVRDNAKTIVDAALLRGNLEFADTLAAGANAKLVMLQGYTDEKGRADEVVRDNAKTIVCTALSKGNLELADALAAGAKAKLVMLQAHADAIVRDNAKTIVCSALVRGNLEFADTLAAGANAKLDVLQAHADAIVRDNAKTIVCSALNHGNLELSDTLAAGAAKACDEMKRLLGEGASNVKMLFSNMLSDGTLDVEVFLKKAA
jgi:hypothetical protein